MVFFQRLQKFYIDNKYFDAVNEKNPPINIVNWRFFAKKIAPLLLGGYLTKNTKTLLECHECLRNVRCIVYCTVFNILKKDDSAKYSMPFPDFFTCTSRDICKKNSNAHYVLL
jgi:hypothetical protein